MPGSGFARIGCISATFRVRRHGHRFATIVDARVIAYASGIAPCSARAIRTPGAVSVETNAKGGALEVGRLSVY
jgi:hypothetical protein